VGKGKGKGEREMQSESHREKVDEEGGGMSEER